MGQIDRYRPQDTFSQNQHETVWGEVIIPPSEQRGKIICGGNSVDPDDFSAIGPLHLGYGDVEKRGIVSPVAGVSVSYKKPVLFDDEVEITVSVKKYNGAVLELEYEFYNATRNEGCTAASSKHCFTKDGKLVSLKREIPELDELFRKSLKGENA